MEFLTPIGRLVQSHPMIGQEKDKDGKPYIIKSGPNKGKETIKYFVSVAFPKMVDYGDGAGPVQNREFAAFYAQMDATARAAFPQLFPNGGPCTHPRFAWKLMDGDGVDANGKDNKTKEGFAGHWVIRFASQYAPRCFHFGKYDPSQQIQNKDEIKTGYYCRIGGTMEGNGVTVGSQDVPGIYVNLNMFELRAYGPEIVSGPDANAVFGGNNANTGGVLPPGATMTPIGGGSAMPGMGGAGPALPGAGGPAAAGGALPPLPGAGGPAATGPATAGPGALPGTAAGINPNAAFAGGAMGGGAAALPPLPGAQTAHTPQLVLTPATIAAGYTVEAFRQLGYNDAYIVQQGWGVMQ